MMALTGNYPNCNKNRWSDPWVGNDGQKRQHCYACQEITVIFVETKT